MWPQHLPVLCMVICLSFFSHMDVSSESDCLAFGDDIPCESISVANADRVVRVGTMGWGSISDITWLPNNNLLAVATGSGIWLYDPSVASASPNLIATQNGVTSVDYNVDENLLLSTSFDGSVTLWGIDSGEIVHRIAQHSDTTNQAMFIADGTSIVSVSNDGTVMIWDIEAESPVFFSELQSVSAIAVHYSSDLSTIAVANSIDGSVILIDSVTGTITSVIEAQENSGDIRALAFNPIDSMLASAGGDGIVIWSRTNTNLAAENYPFIGAVNAVDFSTDGSMMVYGDTSGGVYIWDVEGNIAEPVGELGAWITDVNFSPDNSMLAVGTVDSRVTLWDASSKSLVTSIRFGHGFSINDATFSSDGNLLVSGGEDRVTRLWDVLSGIQLASFDSNSAVDSVLFHPENDGVIASGNSDGTISLWDTTSDTLVAEFGNSGVIRQDISFNSTGEFLASVNEGVTVWVPENEGILSSINVETEWPVNTVAYSPTGDTIAFATVGPGTIYLWDGLNDAADPTILGHHESFVSVITFSPDGNLLVSGGQNTLKLWDLETRQLIQTIDQDLGDIADADFSSDGSLLAFSIGDRLRILNVQDQTELLTIDANFGGIRSIDFNSDNTLIATAGYDGTIQLWGIP